MEHTDDCSEKDNKYCDVYFRETSRDQIDTSIVIEGDFICNECDETLKTGEEIVYVANLPYRIKQVIFD